jgi:hypothetical protein
MIARGARGGLFCRVEISIELDDSAQTAFCSSIAGQLAGFYPSVRVPKSPMCAYAGATGENAILRHEANKSFVINGRDICLSLLLRYEPRTGHRSLNEEGGTSSEPLSAKVSSETASRSARMCIKPCSMPSQANTCLHDKMEQQR